MTESERKFEELRREVKRALDEHIGKPTMYVRPTYERPPREDYVRVTREANGFTLEPALEYRDGDNFKTVTYELTTIAIDAGYQSLGDHMLCARWAAERIAKRWPDRAYFVEVWQDGREGFAQCVQPFGFPRNR